MSLKIAIIGAGPSGCLLARLLVRPQQSNTTSAGFQVTIFEGEENLDFRSQGGTLDLHEGNGQRALKAAGLFEEFQKFARYDGEAFKIADKNLLCYFKTGGAKPGSKYSTGRPEIDRPQLRKLLYEALPPDTVQWGHKLQHVDASSNTLHFTNGKTASGFDLIVGADGAWSKVRSTLTDIKPYFSGIAGHSMMIPDAEHAQPDLYRLVNRGSLFSFDSGNSIMAQYMSDGSLNVVTWSTRPGNWRATSKYDVQNAQAVKSALNETYGQWHPDLKKFFQVADESTFVARDLYMLPIGATWAHRSGVTLIGDAAHLMTPFAGEGVNLALEDSLELAQHMLRSTNAAELDANVHEYEKSMFPRVKPVQEVTYENLTSMFLVPGTPRTSIEEIICSSIKPEMGRVGMWFFRPLVYAIYFVFKLIW